jgi:inner membrane protein
MNHFFRKSAVLLGLGVVMSILLALVHGLVKERLGRKEQVAEEIADSSAKSQRLGSPILRVTVRVAPKVKNAEFSLVAPKAGEGETIMNPAVGKAAAANAVVPNPVVPNPRNEARTRAQDTRALRLEDGKLANAIATTKTAASSQAAAEPTGVLTTRNYYLFPSNLEGSGDVQVTARRRGIYEVPSYLTKINWKGEFTLPAAFDPNLHEDYTETVVGATMMISASDMRGVRGAPTMTIDGAKLSVVPVNFSSNLSGLGASLTRDLVAAHSAIRHSVVQQQRQIPFTADLTLEGTRDLSFAMQANQAALALDSNWKDPSFNGASLPMDRNVTSAGFHAMWSGNSFSSGIAQEPTQELDGLTSAMNAKAFGVVFAAPVDVYTLSDRATKYGFLFIALTFAALLLVEGAWKLHLHPMQFAMVGLAMTLFYLLLLSLSEHIPFLRAYAVAAVACVGLCTAYLREVLGGTKRGLGFGGLLSGIYGALLVLLRSEDTTLLLGSTLLFVVLGVAMFVTRKLDWKPAPTPVYQPYAPYRAPAMPPEYAAAAMARAPMANIVPVPHVVPAGPSVQAAPPAAETEHHQG